MSATCPHCFESVHPKATKCKHCGGGIVSSSEQLGRTVGYILLAGIIVVITIVLLTA